MLWILLDCHNVLVSLGTVIFVGVTEFKAAVSVYPSLIVQYSVLLSRDLPDIAKD